MTQTKATADLADRRRLLEKKARYEAIVDAAEQMFFSQGFEHTTMDDIARRAQLSRALLYVYFRDKAAIMRAIMLRAAQMLLSRFKKALEQGQDGVAQIEGIGRAYYLFSQQLPDYFDVLTNVSTFPEPEIADELQHEMLSCRHDINQTMVAALLNGLEDGTLSRDKIVDPLQTAFYLQGALHGVIMQTRRACCEPGSFADADALVRYTIKSLTTSIQA
ncbi:TetR/AcrR family transcriptional regulator [Pseudohongiella spirulinae]|uniref:TetR family transcriptional regulator n=1 Tax=Pseudohongiella spirulinae TaxID=1249552 RepID=A0A0S2KCH3_9GAMM|nr:TetR/AcrR family transcriptional regulator [Pseudohongiella spirulinae]ALO45995.1 TetR family transcriptional regulator [Pseudohongiella spirulinae]